MASLIAVNEVDPILKNAIKLLHSGNPISAQKLRELLDESIKQKYGSSKTLSNTINSKFLKFELNAPGTKVTKQRKQKPQSIIPIDKTVSISSSSDSMEILETTAEEPVLTIINDDDNAMMAEVLGDCVCVVCRCMESNSKNRLVECSDCHSLYHMDCHTPVISEAEANHDNQDNLWCCTICKSKQSLIKSSAKSSPSSSSNSSFKNSPDRSTSSKPTANIKIVSSDRAKSSSSSSSSKKSFRSHDSKRKHYSRH